MRIELSYPRFFEPKQHSPAVHDAVLECITRRFALRLRLGPAGVVLSAVSPPPDSSGVSLAGRWRSPLLEGAHRSAGALVLAPFVFLTEDLCLPHGSLYTLGRSDRSVADFFVRNVFYAACRCDQIIFRTAADKADAATVNGSRELARRYLWVARAHLKDKVLERRDVAELILASSHIPLLQFTHPLLEAGATEFRAVAAQAEPAVARIEQTRAFRDARDRMLASYRR